MRPVATIRLQSCKANAYALQKISQGIQELAADSARVTEHKISELVRETTHEGLSNTLNRKQCKIALNLLSQLAPRHEALTAKGRADRWS